MAIWDKKSGKSLAAFLLCGLVWAECSPAYSGASSLKARFDSQIERARHVFQDEDEEKVKKRRYARPFLFEPSERMLSAIAPQVPFFPLSPAISFPSKPLPGFTQVAPNDPYYAQQWGLSAINIEPAWNFTKGAGVTIAVVDTGLDFTHPDMLSNTWLNSGEIAGNGIDDDFNGFVDDYRGWDFYGGDNNPTDDNGHGTHVAGISSAAQNNSAGISGVAPESKVMALKVLDANGGGYLATLFDDISNAIRYAADEGARVINMSLGIAISYFNVDTLSMMKDAIDYALEKGAYTVVAAGNSGSLMKDYPALFENVLTIASMDTATSTSYFSSYGPQVDLAAPGSNILSLKASGTNLAPSYDAAGKYMYLSGTSMATPMVAGTMALLLSEYPTLTFEDLYRRLQYSAVDRGPAGFDNDFGYGLINPFKALSEDYYDLGQIKTRWLTSPDGLGVLEYGYDLAGAVIRKVFSSGIIEGYYSGGQLESRFEPATGITREYYLSGALRKQTLASGAFTGYYESGVLFSTYDPVTGNGREYFTDGVTLKRDLQASGFIYEYSLSGALLAMMTPAGDVYEYFASGRRKSFRDKDGDFVTEFLDEAVWTDSFGKAFGRRSKTVYPNGQEDRYTAYWAGTNLVRSSETYQGAVLLSTNTHYTSGNLQTATSQATGVVTHYLDEDFGGDGVGRRSKTVSADGLHVQLMAYYGASDGLWTIEFWDSGALTLIEEHYKKSGNLRSSYSPGTAATTFYFDEDYISSVLGRTDHMEFDNKDVLSITAYWENGNPNNAQHLELSASGGYWLRKSHNYSSDGVLNNTFDWLTRETVDYFFTGKAESFEYADGQLDFYNSDGTMRQRTLKNGSVYQYNSGVLFSFVDGPGARTTEYHPNGNPSRIIYADGRIETFDTAGVLTGSTPASGYVSTFYASGNLKNRLNSSTGKGFDYLDENFYGNGTGRLSRYYAPNGSFNYTYAYHAGTDALSTARMHQSGWIYDRVTAYRPDGTLLYYSEPHITTGLEQMRIDYYPSGRRSRLLYLGAITEYFDEIFYSGFASAHAQGRVSRSQYWSLDRNGQISTWEYHPGTDKPMRETIQSSSGVWQRTVEYFPNGIGASKITAANGIYEYYQRGNWKTFLNTGTGVLQEYYDEDFYGYGTGFNLIHARGRLSRELQPDGAEKKFKEYWPGTDKAHFVEIYQSGVWIKTIEYAPDGVTIVDETLPVPPGDIYEYYPSNNVKSWLNVTTGVLEEYLDENFYGADPQGHGRGRVSRRLYPDQTESQYVEYWPGTDDVKKENKLLSGALLKTVEYNSAGAVTKETSPDGSYFLYQTSGPYAGYRSQEVDAAGQVFYYDYQGTGAAIVAYRRQFVTTTNNAVTIQGSAFLLRATNPVLKFGFQIPNNGTTGQNVVATATSSGGKTLTLTLVSGSGSTYKFNGVTQSLGVTLQKGVPYNAEIRWQSSGIGIFVYAASSTKPSTPTKLITDKAWDPKFKVTALNAEAQLQTGSSGSYTRTTTVADKNNAYLPQNPSAKVDFRFNSSSSSNAVNFTVLQPAVNNITKSLSFKWKSGVWTMNRTEKNATTGATTFTTTWTVNQALSSGINYVAEVRMENGKANLYVYPKGAELPATPLAKLGAYTTVGSRINVSLTNATSSGQLLKNLTNPPASGLLVQSLTAALVQNEEAPEAAQAVISGELLSRWEMEEELQEQRSSSSRYGLAGEEKAPSELI